MSAERDTLTGAVGFDRIHAILDDDSLSAAERNWILEQILMQIDEQLEQHKREVEKAERKLHDLVQAAEQEIASVWREHKGKKLRRLLPSTFAKATADKFRFAKATADKLRFAKATVDKFRFAKATVDKFRFAKATADKFRFAKATADKLPN